MLTEAIPAAVRVSSAYATKEITTKEYSPALRVALLEDRVKMPFCKATWADVRVGDLVLIAWPVGRMVETVEAKISTCESETVHGELIVSVFFSVDTKHYGTAFNASKTVYIQQRG